MRVSEIFYSISGEGIHVGIPTVFVRLVGCNLSCVYCDTQYARDGGEEMTLEQVEEQVYSLHKASQWVLITGGEPLFQEEAVRSLAYHLRTALRKVEVETNGSFDPPTWFGDVDCWSVDVKCPSSGPSYGSFRTKWLKRLRIQDQLKFVVGTKEDLDFVRGFLVNVRIKSTILVSPIARVLINEKEGVIEGYWNREWLQECSDFCKERNVRMNLQIHKLIYGTRRGV